MRKYLPFFVLLISGLLFSFWVIRTWSYTMDDSFISFRYARNLASGLGPVFNETGAPAEGYTCFFWVVIMAIPHLLGINAILFAKLAGIVATLVYVLASLIFVKRATRFLPGDERLTFGCLTAMLIVAFPATAIHAVSGMETALGTMLFALFLYCCTFYAEQPRKPAAVCCCLLGLLLGLTRPEGNLVVIAAFACMAFIVAGKARRLLALSVLFLYVLPGIIYFRWRYPFFGQLLPLPFYIKVLGAKGVFAGLGTVRSFLFEALPVVLIFALVGIIKSTRSLLPMIIGTAVFCAFFIFPEHIMGTGFRFMFPTLPIIVAFAGIGLGWLRKSLSFHESRHSALRRYVPIVIGLMCFTATTFAYHRERRLVREVRAYAAGLNAAHVQLGQLLGRIKSTDASPVLAIADAGAVPYYSGWKTIDIFGLNEPHIATTGQHDPEYVFSQNPDVVVLISYAKDRYLRPIGNWQNPYYKACEDRGMKKIAIFEFMRGRYYLWVYGWPGSAVSKALRRAAFRRMTIQDAK